VVILADSTSRYGCRGTSVMLVRKLASNWQTGTRMPTRAVGRRSCEEAVRSSAVTDRKDTGNP
jgi:hypothetical protein